jgi:hypothetical protein
MLNFSEPGGEEDDRRSEASPNPGKKGGDFSTRLSPLRGCFAKGSA